MPASTFVQTAVFAVGVLLLGLLNSFLNPSALDLGNDYFPANPSALVPSGEPLEHGYESTSHTDLFSYLDLLYEEPPFVVVLDARSAEHYETGHIPGAFLLDQFHQDRYIDALLPTLKQADMVVVYCTGGDCEDSIFLSNSLVYHYGISKDSISIFDGGVALWEEQGYPLKEGAER